MTQRESWAGEVRAAPGDAGAEGRAAARPHRGPPHSLVVCAERRRLPIGRRPSRSGSRWECPRWAAPFRRPQSDQPAARRRSQKQACALRAAIALDEIHGAGKAEPGQLGVREWLEELRDVFREPVAEHVVGRAAEQGRSLGTVRFRKDGSARLAPDRLVFGTRGWRVVLVVEVSGSIRRRWSIGPCPLLRALPLLVGPP